jgi:hypothetical protein
MIVAHQASIRRGFALEDGKVGSHRHGVGDSVMSSVPAFSITCFNGFDVLPAKSKSPPYTTLTDVFPTFSVEVVKVAEPPLNVPVPKHRFPDLAACSPFA